MLKYMLKVCNFQQPYCLHVVVTNDVKWWNIISAVTLKIVERVVAEKFCSKKSSLATCS